MKLYINYFLLELENSKLLHKKKTLWDQLTTYRENISETNTLENLYSVLGGILQLLFPPVILSFCVTIEISHHHIMLKKMLFKCKG